MTTRFALAAVAVAVAACSASARAPAGPTPRLAGCQPIDSLGQAWRVTVFLDGTRVGDHLAARRVQFEPETFELSEADPPALASLRPEEFDLIEFVRGAEAERTLGLCPGYVALRVSAKRRN